MRKTVKKSSHKIQKSFSRTSRVADVVHRILANCIREEFKDPRVGMITICEVSVTPDLRLAKVYISVLEQDKKDQTLKILNEASGFFRSQLADHLRVRVTPKPQFIYDDSVVRGNRIESLLSSTNSPSSTTSLKATTSKNSDHNEKK